MLRKRRQHSYAVVVCKMEEEWPPDPVNSDGEQEQLPMLHDLEWYIERNGIRSQYDASNSVVNLGATQDRLNQEREYQQRVHQKVFGKTDQTENDNRQAFLASIDPNEYLALKVRNQNTNDSPNEPLRVKLRRMASVCDTIYTQASSRPHFNNNNDNNGASDGPLELSLEQYNKQSVVEFIEMVLEKRDPDQVSSDCVVECCMISNYLQCESVLRPMAKILLDSIDSDNCMSLLSLADRLDLRDLFQGCINYMLNSLVTVSDQDDLTPELRQRIATMQEALLRLKKSNTMISDGTQLFFTSMDEYFAMFAETIRYYRERLEDAQQRQEENHRDYGSYNYCFAQTRIDQQAAKVRALGSMMAEQKLLFSWRKQNDGAQRMGGENESECNR